MDNFDFDPSKSQEENIEAFFTYCIEKDSTFGQVLLENKELLIRSDSEAANNKTAFRTKIAQQVIELSKQS